MKYNKYKLIIMINKCIKNYKKNLNSYAKLIIIYQKVWKKYKIIS